jgi:hypothetical protein
MTLLWGNKTAIAPGCAKGIPGKPEKSENPAQGIHPFASVLAITFLISLDSLDFARNFVSRSGGREVGAKRNWRFLANID